MYRMNCIRYNFYYVLFEGIFIYVWLLSWSQSDKCKQSVPGRFKAKSEAQLVHTSQTLRRDTTGSTITAPLLPHTHTTAHTWDLWGGWEGGKAGWLGTLRKLEGEVASHWASGPWVAGRGLTVKKVIMYLLLETLNRKFVRISIDLFKINHFWRERCHGFLYCSLIYRL